MAEALTFNPFDTGWRADRYPFFQRLRREAPVGQIPGLGIPYLTRFADCDAMLRDRRGGTDTSKSPLYRMLAESSGLRMSADIMRHRSFLLIDPPDHTRLRSLVASVFTPRMVQQLRPRIQELADELLDAALASGSLELIADFAHPFPFRVICELVGVPAEDHPKFRAWSRELASTIDPRFDTPPDVAARQMDAMHETIAYFQALVTERRRRPAGGLISTLIAVEEGGDRLTQDELVATLVLLMAAGHETTVNLIGNAVVALLQHPEQLAMLRADPGRTASAVEEALRWDPPVQLTQRIALEDLKIAGVDVAKGLPVVLVLAAANRDEAVVANGERFDICRPGIQHLSFSGGVHYCLGAALARAEGEIALATLIRRLPGMRLGTDSIRYRDSMVMRAAESLPIALG